jgi:hypothetical protein
MHGWFSAMRQYKIYIQLENIETRFILFTYWRQQRRPDGAPRWAPSGRCYWRQYKIYIQLENIKTRFILFTYWGQ